MPENKEIAELEAVVKMLHQKLQLAAITIQAQAKEIAVLKNPPNRKGENLLTMILTQQKEIQALKSQRETALHSRN